MVNTDIVFDPAVVDYIKASIEDAQTGGDTSSEPWARVVQLRDPYIAAALSEWYHITGAEDDDPRIAIVELIDIIRELAEEDGE